ncbi:hypothetical protein [Roseivirga pacifica]|uniref:hypothetical protein n=1 Tax=Roseivirga pacifica TaxID=1267423 RepID=UPI0020949590|nr:hypothetical protein [Roseivirga pacifica]MCO6357397.1 hypothetical protein [Roseivirga pacifica]MCO6367888.1 hypothetical protein [Roseivirga pacifica]MCO6369630.1 hypothetical protein [Roseivirga pacifica]MCO6373484.1 hypothetical protein [Roseivirga pacifica]MCO6377260.1 hypothetical protein [Roseivirga pacifica]
MILSLIDILLDRYFKYPILYDVIIGLTISSITFLLQLKEVLQIEEERVFQTLSDVSNISLTLTGLILTMLTVLITFKSNAMVKDQKSELTEKEVENNEPNLFELFFQSELYFVTVSHLKGSIAVLLLCSTIGYALRFLLNDTLLYFSYSFNWLGLSIIVLAIVRTVIQVNEILSLQKKNSPKSPPSK